MYNGFLRIGCFCIRNEQTTDEGKYIPCRKCLIQLRETTIRPHTTPFISYPALSEGINLSSDEALMLSTAIVIDTVSLCPIVDRAKELDHKMIQQLLPLHHHSINAIMADVEACVLCFG